MLRSFGLRSMVPRISTVGWKTDRGPALEAPLTARRYEYPGRKPTTHGKSSFSGSSRTTVSFEPAGPWKRM